MLFNSVQFMIFFLVVYALYIALPHKGQNRLLLIASYFFYGMWDWRFLLLLFGSTLIDYLCSLGIGRSEKPRVRKALLLVSLISNLGILGFFKYYDFFAATLQQLFHRLGFQADIPLLHVLLPVGISFYVFQTLGYVIDVYRRDIEPLRNLPDFALYISFFPQLVAGPIERAGNLMPQITQPRLITRQGLSEGCFLILWGLFQKVFVADNMARLVEPVFAGTGPSGTMVLLALYAFAFQIYCDFAGYSNIARGLAFCLGFRLMVNFDHPYVSTNPSEFWRRWHISLSTWLRDYLYIPLGGNRYGNLQTYRNLALTMLLGGLWHGAAWTFVCWGAYQGILLIGHRLVSQLRKTRAPAKSGRAAAIGKRIRIIFFFHLVCFGWLLFRAGSLAQVADMLKALCCDFAARPDEPVMQYARMFLFYVGPLVLIEHFQLRRKNPCAILDIPAILRVAVYLVLFYAVILFGVDHAQQFIYFQF